MKVSSKKDKTICLRLNSDDYAIFKYCACGVGMTCSRLMRMFLDSTIAGVKVKIQKGELTLEDIKRDTVSDELQSQKEESDGSSDCSD